MTKITVRQLILCCFLSLFSQIIFAWDHGVDIGYGYSHDPNHTKYNNSGVLLSVDLFPIYQNYWTRWSIIAAAGRWHTTTPVNKNLTTAALTVGVRFYPYLFTASPAYLLASAGPAYLSNRHFGLNTQASNISIQSNLGLGVEVEHFDVNLRLEHFSNAGLGNPNEGFNILYLLSIGYLF